MDHALVYNKHVKRLIVNLAKIISILISEGCKPLQLLHHAMKQETKENRDVKGKTMAHIHCDQPSQIIWIDQIGYQVKLDR